jgi:hypothetical protein
MKSAVREEVHRASIPAHNTGGGAPSARKRWEEDSVLTIQGMLHRSILQAVARNL